MKRIWTALAATMLGSFAMGQEMMTLYTPVRSAADQGITLRSWGSGTAAETDESSFKGNTSIRVATKNFFQGGLILYKTGVDLGKAYGDKTNLLRLTLHTGDSVGVLGGGVGKGAGGAKGGPAGGFGGPAGGGRGQGGPPGGGGPPSGGGFGGPGGGFGGPGGGIGGPGRGAAAATSSTLKTIRVIVHTTDGKWSEAYLNLTTSATSAEWRQIAVPLQAITGFDRTNKVVDRLGFSGDATSTFFVGELGILSETTPIRGEVNTRSLNLANGDEFTFTATGSGGASILKYSWDFDAADGIQEDATGQVVKRKFRKAGKYDITLTVSDEFGLKAPYTITIKVVVNQ